MGIFLCYCNKIYNNFVKDKNVNVNLFYNIQRIKTRLLDEVKLIPKKKLNPKILITACRPLRLKIVFLATEESFLLI